MQLDEDEDKLLRSVALQNARAVLHAREQAERELVQTKDALEQTAESLRESADRLRAVFNQAAVGIAIAALDGRFIETNQKFSDILGYSREELRELTFTDMTHPDDLDRTQANVRQLIAGEIADFVYEKRYLRKDGSVIWSLTTVTLLKDADGKPQRFIGVIEDITLRKQAERERARLTSVLELSLNEIYIFDTETLRFEYVNVGARRNLGYSMDEMRQLTPLDLKPEFTEADFREVVKPLLSDEKEKHLFYTVHRRKDGSLYPVEAHLQSVTHEGQRVFLAVILDITKRKKAEEEIRRSEEELRALANSIPQLAWMAHADGNIFWYNHRWFEYTGTSLKQMEGWGWQSVHDPQMLTSVIERWKHSIDTGEPFEMEFPLRGADGVFRWFLTRVNPVRDAENKVVRWFGTNTDVDEVRRAREALQEETRTLELLNKTGTAIASQLDLQSIVQTVTDAGRELSGAKFGAFFYNVIDEKGESLLLYTLSGAPREAFEKFGHPRATPVFSPTFKGEGVIRSDDITKDPRYGKMSPHHGMPKGHLPVRSYLAVSVISRSGDVIGGLFFGHPEPNIFTERSERLMVGIAAQAAIAIDNARLYEAAQREIAERKRAEEAVREGSERLELALSAGRLGSWSWDPTTDVVNLTDRASEIFGLPPNEPTSWAKMRSLLHEEDRTRTQLAVEKSVADHSDYNVEYRIIRPSGKVTWVLAKGLGIYAKDGSVIGMSGVVQDITERKQLEEARFRLAAVVESSDDAILSKTLDGIITTWNEGAGRIYGYTAAEIIGKSVTILIPPHLLNEEPAIIERLKRGERVEPYETIRRRKDGTLLNVALTVSPIKDASGKIIGASKIARDITDRKRAEIELRKAKDELEQRVIERTASLQETTQQLEAFCYTIAHDLRSPLRAQQSFAQVLLEDYKESLDKTGQDYAQRIISSAQRLDKLVEDLLTYSRLSRSELKFEKLDLGPLVHDMLEHFDDQIQKQRANISLGPLLSVCAYEPTLKLVITNLIANALKFTKPGMPAQIRIWCEPRENFVRLWVEDNGIGIAPEHRAKIFGVFERLHQVDQYPGTGIGLAIVEKGIERMDGQLGFESEPGKGSRFWIELPKVD